VIGVCITAKNEEATIGEIVSSLRGYPVYVADDGSSDDTGIVAQSAGAKTVVRHNKPWGIGPSLMQLWRMALEDGCERIAQLDAGGSHAPDQLSRLLWSGPIADVVVGSRFMKGSDYIGNPTRHYMSRLTTAMCNFAQVGAHHTDWTSGYRVFSAETVAYLLDRRYFAKMHGWQIEVLAWAGYAGFSIAEIPISYIAGESSFDLKVANEAFRVWLHIFNHLGKRKKPR